VTRVLYFLSLLTCITRLSAQTIPPPPQPEREFRGAWVASVRNIDWPSKAGLSSTIQQKELLAILDQAAAQGLNALMLQVRPAGDAFYQSAIEPWSPWLTGEMGRAPSPFWDPLTFAIREAHLRGIQLHAWFNPFRAIAAANKITPSAGHMAMQHPDWVVRYGVELWMNPTIPGVRQQAIDVMVDVAKRYDVDGIHMDDYFYPYPIKDAKGIRVPFDDAATYRQYQATGGKLPLLDWRRATMNTFIRDLYNAVKRQRPSVAFSLSPFGYWRPGVPESIGGSLDPYDDLAADVRLWLREGWMDFLVPQLYWPIQPPELSFKTLYHWWIEENPQHRPVYAGIAIDRVGKGRDAAEILKQIQITRTHQTWNPAGHVHWNWGSLSRNPGKAADRVRTELYQSPALPPPLVPGPQINVPTVDLALSDAKTLVWRCTPVQGAPPVRWYLMQSFDGKKWTTSRPMPATITQTEAPLGTQAVAVRAVNAVGHVGPALVLPVPTEASR